MTMIGSLSMTTTQAEELVQAAEIQDQLRELYGAVTARDITPRLAEIVSNHMHTRPEQRRRPDWDQSDVALISYGDSIQSPSEPPLQTLGGFLSDHLQDTFGFLHLLPLFPFSSDDGFAVTDFRSINPELGNWHHVSALALQLDLAFDLVLNHVSRDHLWFTEYLNDSGPGRTFFIEADPRDQFAMVFRPRNSPLFVDVHTPQGVRHLWATFSHDQIDLNYRNPDVLLEIIDLTFFYIRQGARYIRLDAVAYLWKQPGTDCIHLPQTHCIVKLLRALLDRVEPGCVLITETNVPHAENITYFGDGDEAHMIYQFSLPPLLLHAAHSGSTRYLTPWARALERPPVDCTYFNFTASHDGVGLRPLEGLVPEDEIAVFLEAMRKCGGYISTKTNSDGTDSPYELNIGYFDALRDTSVQEDRLHVERFLLTQTVPLSLQGIPAVYIHSLTATPNDLQGVERTGRTRSINRRKWDRGELEELLADASTPNARVLVEYRRRLLLRRRQAAFHPQAAQQVFDLGGDLFGLRRTAAGGEQVLTAVHNFTPFDKALALLEVGLGGEPAVDDVLTGRRVPVDAGTLMLDPYQCLWLVTP
jgi:sucrose phosphorylase